MSWVVENINGDGSLVRKKFETEQEANAYAELTLGAVRYVSKLVELIENAQEIMIDQNLTKQRKDVLLGDLMTDMEREFKIPPAADPAWEAAHPDVIETYREISDMRSI